MRSSAATVRMTSGMISIGLPAVNLLQSEVSRNDLANTTLINDMLAARDQMFTALEAKGEDAKPTIPLPKEDRR